MTDIIKMKATSFPNLYNRAKNSPSSINVWRWTSFPNIIFGVIIVDTGNFQHSFKKIRQ